MQARALHLLHAVGALVFVGGDNLLHLLRRDGEAAAGRPDAVAFAVEDGRLVDVAGADEAAGSQSERRTTARGEEMGGEGKREAGSGERQERSPLVDVGCPWVSVWLEDRKGPRAARTLPRHGREHADVGEEWTRAMMGSFVGEWGGRAGYEESRWMFGRRAMESLVTCATAQDPVLSFGRSRGEGGSRAPAPPRGPHSLTHSLTHARTPPHTSAGVGIAASDRRVPSAYRCER